MKELAYKLTDASETVAAVEAAEAELDTVKLAAFDLAERIGTGISSGFRRGFNGVLTETVLGLDPKAFDLEIKDEGWRYVKTRDSIEPLLGAKGDKARADLAAVQPPEIQAIHILEKAGLNSVVMLPGQVVRTRWFIWEGVVYALTAESEDFKNGEFGENWTPVKRSEIYAAHEQYVEAFEAAKAAAA